MLASLHLVPLAAPSKPRAHATKTGLSEECSGQKKIDSNLILRLGNLAIIEIPNNQVWLPIAKFFYLLGYARFVTGTY